MHHIVEVYIIPQYSPSIRKHIRILLALFLKMLLDLLLCDEVLGIVVIGDFIPREHRRENKVRHFGFDSGVNAGFTVFNLLHKRGIERCECHTVYAVDIVLREHLHELLFVVDVAFHEFEEVLR